LREYAINMSVAGAAGSAFQSSSSDDPEMRRREDGPFVRLASWTRSMVPDGTSQDHQQGVGGEISNCLHIPPYPPILRAPRIAIKRELARIIFMLRSNILPASSLRAQALAPPGRTWCVQDPRVRTRKINLKFHTKRRSMGRNALGFPGACPIYLCPVERKVEQQPR
jgi:hypothetical protein